MVCSTANQFIDSEIGKIDHSQRLITFLAAVAAAAVFLAATAAAAVTDMVAAIVVVIVVVVGVGGVLAVDGVIVLFY